MRVSGHLEPLAAVLRIGGAYGEPYTYAVPVRYVTPYEVEILGATRAPTPSEWRGVVQTLKAAGVRLFRFDRRDGSAVTEHQIDIGADTPRHSRKERDMNAEKFKKDHEPKDAATADNAAWARGEAQRTHDMIVDGAKQEKAQFDAQHAQQLAIADAELAAAFERIEKRFGK